MTRGAGLVVLPECFNRCVSRSSMGNARGVTDVFTFAVLLFVHPCLLFLSPPNTLSSPYATDQFPVYAEEIPGDVSALDEAVHPTTFRLHSLAKRHGIYLIGGSCKQPARPVRVCSRGGTRCCA